MTQPVRLRKTHHIKIPASTDVQQLLGCYNNLFIARGLTSVIPFTSEGDFTHPMPESYQQLLHDFMQMNSTLHGLAMSYEAISVDDVQVNPTGRMATFFFSMQEKQDNVLFIDQ
ncbi:hypothetical protein NFI00_000122 [Salmonella enterica]|nr:hypothetical protein [Salmonella enterica]